MIIKIDEQEIKFGNKYSDWSIMNPDSKIVSKFFHTQEQENPKVSFSDKKEKPRTQQYY